MKRIILVATLSLVMFSIATSQTPAIKASGSADVERQIMQVENESREATLKNDAETLDRLLADNWMNTNANGTVTTKAQLMALLKSSPFKIMSIENDEVLVRVYDDTAVVTGRSTSKRAGRDDQIVTGQVRFTRVWVKAKGSWRVVAAQSTPITQQ